MTGPLGLFGVMAVVLFAGVTDVSNALPPQKILGGSKAVPGEFPYMVSLRWRGKHACGGVIIGPRHILTAAHVFSGIKPSLIYNRATAATGSVSVTGGNIYNVREVVVHSDYVSASSDTSPATDALHDIAIVVLREDIAFNENQTSIALPTELVPDDVFGNLTGWGFDEESMVTSELMKVKLKILRADSCTRRFADGFVTINTSNICSFGGWGVSACMHDSGGPLVYNGQVVGVVSWGFRGCGSGYPDVFTSVYHHVDWIKKTMEESSAQP